MQSWSLEERISLKTNANRVQGTLVEKLIRQRRPWRGRKWSEIFPFPVHVMLGEW